MREDWEEIKKELVETSEAAGINLHATRHVNIINMQHNKKGRPSNLVRLDEEDRAEIIDICESISEVARDAWVSALSLEDARDLFIIMHSLFSEFYSDKPELKEKTKELLKIWGFPRYGSEGMDTMEGI